jgi:hypothetical protein
VSLDQELKDIIRDLFELMYSGWTDEDLLLRPRELRHFTRLVGTIASRNLNSYTVSGVLMNERKRGGKGSGKPRKNSASLLKLEVKASQVQITIDEFKRAVTDVFLRDHHPSGVEQLIRRCDDAMEFCKSVRDSIGMVGDIQMPDTMILRTLVSLRKAGRFRTVGQGVGNGESKEKALKEKDDR